MHPTPLEDLRRPHPDQRRIDAETAALLRTTWQMTRARRARPAPSVAVDETQAASKPPPRS